MGKIFKTVLPALALLLLAAAPARACPMLEKAAPRVGGTVAQAPKTVTLHFTGPVLLDKSSLEVRNAAGKLVSHGKLIEADHGATVGVAVDAIPPGRYKVRWSIHCHCQEDEDTAIPGSYSFTVAP